MLLIGILPCQAFLTGFHFALLQKSPDVQFLNTSLTNGDCHFTARNGKQELYAGSGVYISCVELHTILARTVGKPQDLLGQLVNYFFDDQTLAISVPLQGSRSKHKNVLDQRIVHAIIGTLPNSLDMADMPNFLFIKKQTSTLSMSAHPLPDRRCNVQFFFFLRSVFSSVVTSSYKQPLTLDLFSFTQLLILIVL